MGNGKWEMGLRKGRGPSRSVTMTMNEIGNIGIEI